MLFAKVIMIVSGTKLRLVARMTKNGMLLDIGAKGRKKETRPR